MTDKRRQYVVSEGEYTGYGVTMDRNGIVFSLAVPCREEAFLILYEKGSEQPLCEIPMPEQPRLGSVRCIRVEGIDPSATEYNFRIGKEVVTDPAARVVTGRTPFADLSPRREHQIRGAFPEPSFDWKGDRFPALSYEDVVAYYLHVRGFTKGKNARVRHPGTFKGIQEKLPYLKELGVNQLILMPAYEFEEAMRSQVVGNGAVSGSGKDTPAPAVSALPPAKLNYWGYTKSWYYAPKESFSSCAQADREVKELVRALHAAGMELILEFAFPDETDPAAVTDVLSYWVRNYHVDGFRLLACPAICNSTARSPLLRCTKLMSGYYDPAQAGLCMASYPYHLADFHDGFRQTARKLLKGDEGQLSEFIARMKEFPTGKGLMNSITGHDGFTLCDLVSYDGKHNEENQEGGQDGAVSEFSWNCGAEGPTKKKSIKELRLKQMKNALAMLLLAQGTPVLLAGDEHANSQGGNNNPYCIDSEVTWLDWRKDIYARELTAFTRTLIAFRKSHPLLRGMTLEQQSSTGPGGYPVFSCHSNRAWYGAFDYQNRHAGLMYCARNDPGKKEGSKEEKDGKEKAAACFLYLAFNLHWEEQTLALPYLPEGMHWSIVVDTGRRTFGQEGQRSGTEPESGKELVRELVIPGRTVYVLEGNPDAEED